MAIGRKNIRQFTSRYSIVNSIVEEFCRCQLMFFFPYIPKESHDEVFPW